MQTTYNTDPPVAYAGLEVDTEPSRKRNAVNEESIDIPFGILVARGAADGQAKLPDTPADALKILGAVLSTYWQDNRGLSDSNGVAAGDPMNVMEEGGIWVLCEQDVVLGDLGKDVFVRVTANGGNTQLGKVRKDADSGNAVHVKGVIFDSAATAGQLVKLRLRAPLGGTEPGFVHKHAHAAATVDSTEKVLKNRADRHLLITEVLVRNPTGLAADAVNYFAIKLQETGGGTVYATWSTDTGQEGTLGADTYHGMTLGAAPVVAPGEELDLFLDETGTATLPAGEVIIHGEFI